MRLFLLAATLLFSLQNCQKNTSDNAPETVTDRHFHLRTAEETGVKFANKLRETAADNVIVNPYLYNGGGVAVLDANGDDLPDLFFSATQQACKLYINRGNFRFEDVTRRAAILTDEGTKSGVAVADVNGDGLTDIYVCRTGRQPSEARRNLLFINNGAVDGYPTFTEMGKEYGLDDPSASNHANFFDYDLDGDLDCYVLNYPADFHKVGQMNLVQDAAGNVSRSTRPLTPYDTDRLFRNDGGHFTDVTEQAGVVNYAWGLSATVSDVNSDGWPDIYVANDYIEHDFLYINNRNGTFTDRSMQAFKHFAHNAMGVDIADLNNDGHLDMAVLDMLAPTYSRQKTLVSAMLLERYTTLLTYGYGHQLSRNMLQIGNGDGTFSDLGCLSGTYRTDWSWSPLLADFDNDGHRDLYISNGYRRDVTDMDYMVYTADSLVKTGKPEAQLFANMDEYLRLIPSVPQQKFMFKNRGEASPGVAFDDVSTAWGLTEKAYSNGAAYADLDRDGDLDLIANNLDNQAFIYENTSAGNGWLQVVCAGPKGNPTGIGAKIRVTSGGQRQVAEMTNVRGFLSCSEAIAQFGLGKNAAAERVEIRWPDGKIQTLENVAANTRLTLKHADARGGKWLENPQPAPVFSPANAGLNFRHTENQFEDLTRERLLTHRFSRSGPALAVADANGDGTDDVFFGGAAGQPGSLFLQKNGAFSAAQIADFQTDKSHEDVAAAFFDADGDGDQDLYVVSGGNEEPAGSAYYQDRLYLNAGGGKFARAAADALPTEAEAGSCALPIDFDRDGKMDLVVGGSVVPGRFPEACKTLFLRNLGGKFVDATAQFSPNPSGQIGLVNDLKAADLDGDGQLEIVAAGEWMPVLAWKFEGGKWRDASADFGLSETNGWWNCLEISDLNGDGRLDIVAGNLGLNTRHRASAASPMRLFAKDIDGNGSLDPIVAIEEAGRWVPLVTRDLLLKQVPPLKKKFLRFLPYAHASVEEVVTGVNPLEIKMLESVWFENLGGKFAPRPLPLAAQVAPVKGIAAGDFNADGKVDLLLVGNDSQLDIETGPADASQGVLLAGDGRGGWSVAQNSGFVAAKEARKIAVARLPNGRKMVVVANNDGPAEAWR